MRKIQVKISSPIGQYKCSEHWICECKGITSKVDARKYPNYESVMPSVDVSKLVNLDKKTWMAAKKWIKSSSYYRG